MKKKKYTKAILRNDYDGYNLIPSSLTYKDRLEMNGPKISEHDLKGAVILSTSDDGYSRVKFKEPRVLLIVSGETNRPTLILRDTVYVCSIDLE